jgi:hypothetical protein
MRLVPWLQGLIDPICDTAVGISAPEPNPPPRDRHSNRDPDLGTVFFA